MDAVVEIQCLQEALYFESRSEGKAGQLAVALVIMNRVRDKRWPNNVCDVVHQPYQFSYYSDGKPEIYHDKRAKSVAGVLAEMVFFGTVVDFTEKSLYYYATWGETPKWDYGKIERVMSLDSHVFFKDKRR